MNENLENNIRQILEILNRCDSPNDSSMPPTLHDETEIGEILLRRVSLLADRWRDATGNLNRARRDLAVFKKTYADVNRMLEEKIDEFSLLRLVVDMSSRAMSTEDPFRLILDKVITIVGAENGCIMLKSVESGLLEMHAVCAQNRSDRDSPLFGIIKKVADQVVVSGKPYFIGDISKDSGIGLAPGDAKFIGSLASFPLVVENGTIGVLSLDSLFPRAFGEETKRIMHIIAGHIAVAVDNARLYGEIRKTKEYLENLVEKAGDAIFTLDRDHKIVSWNTGADVIFKRDKQNVLGKNIYSLIPETLSPQLREKIESILESDNVFTTETDALRGDGQVKQIALTLSPIHDADGEIIGISGIAKDITERKQIEEELRRLNETKTNFISTVSHELRTPLTSIKSLTEVLLSELTSLPEVKVRRSLSIINEECDHLSELISSVLDLQKLDAGRFEVSFEKVPLADVVRQTAELFASFASKKNIELKTDFLAPDHMTKVRGSHEQLLRMVSNLVSNALKYTDPGCHVCVRLTREEDKIRLAVEDDGIGISDGDEHKVFEKFYRVNNALSRKDGGTGLGLAITKELVVLHGGEIWVENRKDKGCCFNILLSSVE
jgi:two-component system sensor histidine kinase VicK